MDSLIKSPAVARRLRGMGGAYYIIDAGTPTEIIVRNARHFAPKGFSFDALCREGRISLSMGVGNERSCKRLRRIVSREIKRQAALMNSCSFHSLSKRLRRK